MTKAQYIKNHKKAYLTRNLENATYIPMDAEITVVGGQIAPTNKNSNLYRALKAAKIGVYVIGGRRQMKTEGWWFAVA